MRTLLLILLALLTATLTHAGETADGEGRYFGDRERGWFWYQDPPIEEEPEETAEAPPQAAPAPQTAEDPQAQLQQYQKRFDDAKALAVMQPTDDHVRRYIEVQKEAYDRSALFADIWRRVVWSNPTLDYSLEHPTNTVGAALDQQQTRQRQAEAVAALAESEGLFFFFSQSCPHCHSQSQILEQFSRRYGIRVMAISLDGGVLPEFPDARLDNGLAARLGVAVTPALYMVNPRTQEITPLGYGVMTESELTQRIHTLTAAKRGRF